MHHARLVGRRVQISGDDDLDFIHVRAQTRGERVQVSAQLFRLLQSSDDAVDGFRRLEMGGDDDDFLEILSREHGLGVAANERTDRVADSRLASRILLQPKPRH